ncbi:MAG: hypothetical protein QOJ99_838 [Bryobacterales bacterium]|jgi:hypothetical protein|nr:hypothetical protein [Bryobacterales bacterium]
MLPDLKIERATRHSRHIQHGPVFSVDALGCPIPVEKHFSPAFYAELWGVSSETVVRRLQGKPGVLKLRTPSSCGFLPAWI